MSRINNKEIKKAIFQPNKKKTTQEEDTRSVVVYTIIGQQDEDDVDGNPIINDSKSINAEDRPTAYAKRTKTQAGRFKYYVKQGDRAKLANPIGMYAETLKAKPKEGRPSWKFREVSLKVFNKYVQFLKTKNTAWLIQAEREMI